MDEKPVTDETPSDDGGKFFTAPLILIFAIVFIDLIGFGMVIPVLPIYAQNAPFLASPWEIGWLVAIYSWMQFIFSPLLGKLSDRYGRRPILFVSMLGSAAGYLILGFANTLLLVFIGRLISGVTGGNISAAQAYIADITTRENRAKGMALFGAAFGLGFVLGPAIGGISSKYGVHVPFFVAAALSMVSAIAVYLILPETRRLRTDGEADTTSWRISDIVGSLRERDFGTINLNYFLLVTSFSIMTYAFVLYTAHIFGYNAEQNGYLFAFVGLAAVFGQGFLFSTLVRRFGETRLVAIGCITMALGLFLLPFVTPVVTGLAGLLGICLLFALGNALASPGLNSLASKVTHEHQQGSRLGVMQSGASLARAIGPMIGGLLLNNAAGGLDHSTLYRTFFVAAAIMFLAFLIALYSIKVMGRDIPGTTF